MILFTKGCFVLYNLDYDNAYFVFLVLLMLFFYRTHGTLVPLAHNVKFLVSKGYSNDGTSTPSLAFSVKAVRPIRQVIPKTILRELNTISNEDRL